MQETAYACMYYEMTGIPVKKLITIYGLPKATESVKESA